MDLATTTITSGQITATPCADGVPLYPRSSGYTIGLTTQSGETSADRILLMGGDVKETNVYYSDTCGKTWSCVPDPEVR